MMLLSSDFSVSQNCNNSMNRLPYNYSCISPISTEFVNNVYLDIKSYLISLFSSMRIDTLLGQFKNQTLLLDSTPSVKTQMTKIGNLLDITSQTYILVLKQNIYNPNFSSLVCVNIIFLSESQKFFRPFSIVNNIYMGYSNDTNVFFYISILLCVINMVLVGFLIYKTKSEKEDEVRKKKEKEKESEKKTTEANEEKIICKVTSFFRSYFIIPKFYYWFILLSSIYIFAASSKQDEYISSLANIKFSDSIFYFYDPYVYEKNRVIQQNAAFYILSLIVYTAFFSGNAVISSRIVNTSKKAFSSKLITIVIMTILFIVFSVIASFFIFGEFDFPYYSSGDYLTIKALRNLILGSVDSRDDMVRQSYNEFTSFFLNRLVYLANEPYDLLSYFATYFVYLVYSLVFYITSRYLLRAMIISIYSIYYFQIEKQNQKNTGIMQKINNLIK